MTEVALVAFADTWGWDCSLVLTDLTVRTIIDWNYSSGRNCSEMLLTSKSWITF